MLLPDIANFNKVILSSWVFIYYLMITRVKVILKYQNYLKAGNEPSFILPFCFLKVNNFRASKYLLSKTALNNSISYLLTYKLWFSFTIKTPENIIFKNNKIGCCSSESSIQKNVLYASMVYHWNYQPMCCWLRDGLMIEDKGCGSL